MNDSGLQRMRLAVLRQMLLVFCLTAVSSAVAGQDIALFSVDQRVDSESSAERNRASQSALKTLLVRVTGDREAIRRYPGLANSVGSASRYVISYSYSRKTAPRPRDSAIAHDDRSVGPVAGGDSQNSDLYLTLVFQSDAIMQLLQSAGAPYWQADRPGVLVWLADDSEGERQLVNAETSPLRFDQLRRAASLRGIPLIQPLLDLEEYGRISPDDVWRMNYATVDRSSRRYDNGAVLVGKLSQAFDQSWLGQWTLLYRGQRQTQIYRGASVDDFFNLAANMAADAMAADYAVQSNQRHNARQLRVRVSGIQNHRDYVTVVEYLRSIQALSNIQLNHIEADRCEFTVTASGQIDKIQSLIALNNRLQLQGGGSYGGVYQGGQGSQLNYVLQSN